MATETWGDPFFSSLSQEEKLVFIYLITNRFTKQIGIYELNIKHALIDLGMTGAKFQAILKKFNNKKKIMVDPRTSEIFLVNWNKHNFSGSPKVYTCVTREYRYVKSRRLRELLLSQYYLDGFYPIEKIRAGFDSGFTRDQAIANEDVFYPMTNDEIQKEIIDEEIKEQARERVNAGKKNRKTKDELKFEARMNQNLKKRKTGEYKELGPYVLLKAEEYEDLCEQHGAEIVDTVIDDMNDWLANKTTPAESYGYYVSYRGAINQWVKKEKQRRESDFKRTGQRNDAASKIDRLASL